MLLTVISFGDWEFNFLNWIQTWRTPALDVINAFFSNLGNAGLFWMILAVILMIPKKTRRLGFQMGCAMLLTYILGNLILKNVVDRLRPCDIAGLPEGILVKRPTDSSFPSGHTMNGFTAALTIMYNNWKWGIPALILAAIIAFSRMYNYMHFPTDVIGAILIAIFSSVIMHIIFKCWAKKIEQKKASL